MKSRQATESDPVSGDELVESDDLKRKLRDAKERLITRATWQAAGREGRRSSFAFLRTLHVLLCEGNGIGSLAHWLSAGAFSFSASLFI